MAGIENSVPVRWLSGPLEIARRERSEGFTPQSRQTLERWHDPAALDILRDTPVDCLVLSWAAGLAADAEQQRTAVPLVQEARRRGLAVVGWVEGPEDPKAALAAAKAAGLAAVGIRGFQGRAEIPVIAWGERANMPWDAAAPALAVADNVWPGVNISSGGGAATAGPTSVPWLDSNGWYVQLARARVETPLWLMVDPPAKGAVVSAESYANTIIDSETWGGRWVISLDENLRAELAAGTAAAQRAWNRIAATARFFEDHSVWKSYRSLGPVGVISDFSGDNFTSGGEILNLMARRDLLFRVIWKSRAMAQSFAGLRALIYADAAPPDTALRGKITSFVEQGGLLIAGPKWPLQGKPVPPDFDTQFDVRTLGKGRLAVARKELDDPYQVAVDTQFLLSHRYDLMKVYNNRSSGCSRFTASADGKTALLQCLNFAAGPSAAPAAKRTVWVREQYRGGRLWTIGSAPVPLNAEPSEEYFGVEYHLPAMAAPSYLALEFEA
jgi:hypothetical protein